MAKAVVPTLKPYAPSPMYQGRALFAPTTDEHTGLLHEELKMSGMGHGRGLIGWVSGIIAAVISGVLVVVLTAGEPKADNTTPSPPRPTECCNQTIDFAITDQLGEGQITERIAVVIDGRSVGTLVVDVVHANSTLTVTVPEPGTYSYRLEGSMVVEDGYGGTVSLTGAGSGEIEASNGRAFALMGDYSSDPVRLSLQ